jgi:tetratricopeptide (TPR) repeat protein
MPSIIEGYTYDIFISYRQKDNKYDGWVTEFVDNLKKELEATFKESVSVYFDINPSDYLLETYDVDASLKDKLKCLVFIPILSRTYCDPKAFAWEYEFKAFAKHAAEDKYGLKIKLPNSNVANRILPVRIHDLDNDDIKLCESILGGALRGVEFIYKEPGVNRSLSPKDHEEKNLNITNYRNQINKVALAIKEIIIGMKEEPAAVVKEKNLQEAPVEGSRQKGKLEVSEKPAKLRKLKLISEVTVIAIFIVAAVLAYPKILKKNTLEKLRSSGERISVAVMPFQNITNDATKNFWQELIQDNLITYLSGFSNELKVRQSESVNTLIQSKNLTNYASITPSVAKNISQRLDANIFIYGSIQQAGTKLRVNAKLIDTKTEDVLKSFEIDGPNKEETIFDITDSLRKKVTDFLLISKLGKKISPDFQFLASSSSPDAYRNFIYGNNAFMNQDFATAVKFYLQAISADSNFYFATLSLSLAYLNQNIYDQAKKWCQRVYKNRDQMPMQQHKMITNWVHAYCFETPVENIKYIQQLLEYDDQVPRFYYNLGRNYIYLYQYYKAIPEFKKALEIYNKWNSKPMWVANYTMLGLAYHNTLQYNKEKKIYKEAEKDFPDNPDLIYRQAVLALSEGNTKAAQVFIEEYISIQKENSKSEAAIKTSIAKIYNEANILDKAEEYFRLALSLEPGNTEKMNDLSYFLIEKDRNIDEGIELVESTLGINPNSYKSLHNKGWGLYKQGKYKEALEILQRSWDLRREKAVYDHEAFLHLEAAKKALAEQKIN